MLVKAPLVFLLFAYSFLLRPVAAYKTEKIKEKSMRKAERGSSSANSKIRKKVLQEVKESNIQANVTGPRNDLGCTNIGGICQRDTYVCQGRYLRNKCAGPKARRCCMPGGAWSIFCAGHHHNRVRACDNFGCGAYNSRSESGVHKAADIVCDDYGIVLAPFAGKLGGPVGRKVTGQTHYDGVKLTNNEHCVKIFNIRPYRYTGPIGKGEELGYVLPLQELFSGITSHFELQMCDLSDPSPFI